MSSTAHDGPSLALHARSDQTRWVAHDGGTQVGSWRHHGGVGGGVDRGAGGRVRPAAGCIHCRIHCRSGARAGRADVHGSAGGCGWPESACRHAVAAGDAAVPPRRVDDQPDAGPAARRPRPRPGRGGRGVEEHRRHDGSHRLHRRARVGHDVQGPVEPARQPTVRLRPGTGGERPRGMDRDRADLAVYERDIGSFIQTATKAQVSAPAAQQALTAHVDDLLKQADAYAAKDYATSYAIERHAYAHMFEVAKTLATGFFATTTAGVAPLNAPRVRLQSALGKLLGEHMALAVDSMRAAATKTPDFQAAGAALNGNTADLTAAMGVLFGQPSATAFSGIWGDHVDALVSYGAAVAGQDAAGQDTATNRLTQFESRFADFLSTGTEGRLTAPALRDAYVMHDRDLVGQMQAFARRDYTASNDTVFAAYQQMFDVAEQVSTAAGDTVAARLPQGGVDRWRHH